MKIVARETDPVNLRLKEAFYIPKQKPGINSREECSKLTDLLFLFNLLCLYYIIFFITYTSVCHVYIPHLVYYLAVLMML